MKVAICFTLIMGTLFCETTHEEIFTPQFGFRYIDKTRESYSGAGSTIARTTAIRNKLPALLRQFDCRVLIDAPCGDFNWIEALDLPVDEYIGVDVIAHMIQNHQEKHENEQRRFIHMDITKEVLPKGDIVLTRDTLIHFSYEDIVRYIKLLKKSGNHYLLTSHFPEQKSNSDITTGAWRPVNLEISPFNFPEPLVMISEEYTANPLHSDKCLALWNIDDLPDFGE